MNPGISEDGRAVAFADDTPVMVRYPRTPEQLWGDRAEWPWLPGTIMEQCGPDEWRVVVEDVTVAVRKDGSKPAPRTPKSRLYYPCCLRDSSELMLRGLS
jgi:hypothetical protein